MMLVGAYKETLQVKKACPSAHPWLLLADIQEMAAHLSMREPGDPLCCKKSCISSRTSVLQPSSIIQSF